MMKHFDAHPFIISLYDIAFRDLRPVMIVELAKDTNTDYLMERRTAGERVGWDTKARFCTEVPDGLRALHGSEIVHGNIKGENILLFADLENEGELTAKIAGFGFSSTAISIRLGGGTGGTPFFCAPECLSTAKAKMREYENKPTKDNYAFGLFVWQVAMDGETPYDGLELGDVEEVKRSDQDLQFSCRRTRPSPLGP